MCPDPQPIDPARVTILPPMPPEPDEDDGDDDECPRCGHVVNPDDQFCWWCKEPL